MEVKWVLKYSSKEDNILLSKSLKIEPLFAKLLLCKNLKTIDNIKRFINPSLDELNDPFIINGMSEAVDKIKKCILNKEKILIYGDYDVDGTTSISMLYLFICNIYDKDKIGLYSPDRISEGYGISNKALKQAIKKDYKLLISLDCGTNDINKIKSVKDKIDIIVCDHHISNKDYNSYTLINPLKKNCIYPYKYLSACGVTFKLIQAISISKNIPFSDIKPFLDFVCVSIASDIVPITGENRVLAYHGLKELKQKTRLCFQLLSEKCNLYNDIKISDIVFGFAPRINAASRMNHAKDAINLMISSKTEKAKKYIEKLEILNRNRKVLQDKIFKSCIIKIENDKSFHQNKCIILKDKSWHKGLIGIVASKLVERFYKPTLIFTQSNEFWVGSGRSIKNFDLNAALSECCQYIKQFGGHTQAVGLTVEKSQFNEFQNKFIELTRSKIDIETSTYKLEIDAKIKCRDITNKLMNFLKKLEPFGPYNMNPIFMVEGVIENQTSKYLGDNKEHLMIYFYDESNKNRIYKGILFNVNSNHPKLEDIKGRKIDITFIIEENFWQNYPTIEIIIKDFRLS